MLQDGFYNGMLTDGRCGLVPSNFVRQLYGMCTIQCSVVKFGNCRLKINFIDVKLLWFTNHLMLATMYLNHTCVQLLRNQQNMQVLVAQHWQSGLSQWRQAKFDPHIIKTLNR